MVLRVNRARVGRWLVPHISMTKSYPNINAYVTPSKYSIKQTSGADFISGPQINPLLPHPATKTFLCKYSEPSVIKGEKP